LSDARASKYPWVSEELLAQKYKIHNGFHSPFSLSSQNPDYLISILILLDGTHAFTRQGFSMLRTHNVRP